MSNLTSKTMSDMQRFAKKERVGKLFTMVADNTGIRLKKLRAQYARSQGVALITVDGYIEELADNEEVFIEFDGVEHYVWEINMWHVEEVKRKEDRARATEDLRKRDQRKAVTPLTAFIEEKHPV